MKTTKRVLLIGGVLISLLLFPYFGLFVILCWLYPSEFIAPDWVQEWRSHREIARYRAAAERGDAEAMWHLGTYYDSAISVPLDKAEAVRWFRKIQWFDEAAELLQAINKGERPVNKTEPWTSKSGLTKGQTPPIK